MTETWAGTPLLMQEASPREVCELHTLLLAAEPQASHVANCLRSALGLSVVTTGGQAACVQELRRSTFHLVLLEESVTALDAASSSALYEAAGSALIVEINFGLTGSERIVAAVRSALRRRERDLQRARDAAIAAVRQELTASLTGLLLEAQLAVRQAGAHSPPALERMVALAEHVCDLLRTGNSAC